MERRVFITGGTGFIGRALVRALADRGDRPVVLTRSAGKARSVFGGRAEVVAGDPTVAGDWQDAVRGCAGVVNLAGAPMDGRRWDARYRQVLRDSRVDATNRVVGAIAACPDGERPRVLASASGIDYYPFEADLDAERPASDGTVTERTPPGTSFLARLCRDWEAEAYRAEDHGVRVVVMRTGVVLGPGGALAKMKRPFVLFVGGRLGSGKQWMSWVHLDDVVHAYLRALDDDTVSGPLNLVAPNPVRNQEFSRALARALGRPAWLPVPEPAVRAAVGELGDYLVHGRRAVPKALEDRGFQFAHPDLGSALQDAL